MADGKRGKRKGAPKTGGRIAGTPNKRTLALQALTQAGLEAARHSEELPLAVILRVMRGDPTITELQFQAAQAAAPYIHARLASTTLTHKDALSDISDEQLDTILTAAQRIIGGATGADIAEGEAEACFGEQDQGLSALH